MLDLCKGTKVGGWNMEFMAVKLRGVEDAFVGIGKEAN
jgi:hypothetical protein